MCRSKLKPSDRLEINENDQIQPESQCNERTKNDAFWGPERGVARGLSPLVRGKSGKSMDKTQ